MHRRLWLLLFAVGLAACGGGTTAPTSAVQVVAGEFDLSGLTLDVHQAPG